MAAEGQRAFEEIMEEYAESRRRASGWEGLQRETRLVGEAVRALLRELREFRAEFNERFDESMAFWESLPAPRNR